MAQNKKQLQLIFRDMTVTALEEFAGNTDVEKYGAVAYSSPSDPIIDFKLNVLMFAIDSDIIIVEFPNHNTGCFKLNNNFYFMIEVI